MKTKFKIGNIVKHKHRENRIGKIVTIEEGCNPIIEVDFGFEFLSLTPPQDMEKLALHGLPVNDFTPNRSCCANDVILVSQGTQCTNCGHIL